MDEDDYNFDYHSHNHKSGDDLVGKDRIIFNIIADSLATYVIRVQAKMYVPGTHPLARHILDRIKKEIGS